ncbi:MAG: Na(+)-translocating NADH-quinone reductase subunit C [Mariniblastus sp.]
MPANKDSLGNTFAVAAVLCLVCSLVVSAAAVALKPIKDRNVALDRKNNILQVTGFSAEEIKNAGGIEELFKKRFKATIIDLETGEEAIEECKAALEAAGKQVGEDVVDSYDQFWASKSKKEAVATELEKSEDKIGIKWKEKYSHVFVLQSEDGSSVEKYVFPVRGNGLWSMMQGYFAVEPDFQTVAGITFYDQAETPGLGGEVMNPNWKAKWNGKKIYDEDEVKLKVSKGDQSSNKYGVDGLSGATITSNGVTYMLEFWLGPKGFKPYIENQKGGAGEANSKAANYKTASETGGTRG